MKILVIDFDKLHHKNRRGLIEMFTFIQRNINSELKYLIGNISHIQNNFERCHELPRKIHRNRCEK